MFQALYQALWREQIQTPASWNLHSHGGPWTIYNHVNQTVVCAMEVNKVWPGNGGSGRMGCFNV